MQKAHPRTVSPAGEAAEPAAPTPQNLRRFLVYAQPYRWIIASVILLGVTRYGLQFVTPWGIGVLLDGALHQVGAMSPADRAARLAQVNWVAALVTGALVARCFAQFGETLLTSRIGNRLVFDLRRRLYVHIHGMSQSFFDRHQVGSIGSRVLNDIAVTQNLVGSGVISVVIDTVALMFTLAILARLEWRLTLVACTIMPIYVVALKRLNPGIRKLSQEIQDRFSEISGTVYETLAGMQVVQAFTKERSSERQFVHECRGHYERLLTRTRLNAKLNFATVFLTGFGTILLLWFGGRLVIAGTLTAGMLVQFYSYVAYLYGPLSRFAELNNVYQNSMGAVDRVFEMLDTPSEVVEQAEVRDPVRFQGQVSFDDVRFGYEPERPVLHGVSLDVESGQMIAFVGPSGSGKTTVTRLLLRFYDVTGGGIRFDGHDLRDLPLRELRQQVGVVLQEPVLFTGSVRQNIELGRPGATEEEIIEAAKAANAHDFIMELSEGYDTKVGERGAHLSGGQRQRVSIARALLKDPRILILDEATSALDSESERLIQDALQHLMEGRTSFVIAHRLSTIVNADQIVVLDRGRVVEQGRHEELLLQNGLYAELCAKQFIGLDSEQEADWSDALRVEEVMSREFTLVPEELPIDEVFTLMQVTHQHGFPVGNAAGELVGVITLSDVEAALFESDPGATAGTVCSRPALVCYTDQTLHEALQQLGARDVGRLPVVERDHPRRMVGLLRRADMVLAYSRLARCSTEQALASAQPETMGDLKFFRVNLDAASPAAGRRVRELRLPEECILVSIRRVDHTLVPRGETQLEPGDCIMALGRAECMDALQGSMAQEIIAC